MQVLNRTMNSRFIFIVLLLCAVIVCPAQQPVSQTGDGKEKVKNSTLTAENGNGPKTELQNFPLSAVRLLESPFKQAQETDLKYILGMDPDRLLAPFLREAGLEPKAPNYGNWEGSGLGGHIGGHYLSALSNMYAASGNKEVLQRLNYMLDELEKCQQQNGNGYVGGIPGGKELWKEIAAGKINAGGFSLNGRWVPLYNIHKLFAGLVDAYTIAGVAKAKEILTRLSDWCVNLTAGLSDNQMQQMLRSEHGGMNEVFADVSVITGDKKYLELAERFSHRFLLNPLLHHKDSLTGLHANTQIPKVIGYARITEAGGDPKWADAAAFFWQTVVNNRSVSIGGNSVREHFHPSNDFGSMIDDREGPETCNTYNMLKLTKRLFLENPQADYMDYYERGLYNHILSSQHPNGGFVYFTPMRPRHYRVYSQVEQGFWCCVGSGLENHGKYGELIYAHNKEDLYVNLFIPSKLVWKEKGLELVQKTGFPYENQSTLELTLQEARQFSICIRYPSWVKNGSLKVQVNKKEVTVTKNANGYFEIDRQWKTGDVIALTLPMEIEAERLQDNSPWVSFRYGPVVLAAATEQTDLVGLQADSSRMGHIASGPSYPIDEAPMMVTPSKSLVKYIQPVKGKPLHFTAKELIYPARYKNLELKPFFETHDTRYMIYWRGTDKKGLAQIQEELRKKEEDKLALEASTLDQVSPGEQQPESDHGFRGEKTGTGYYKDNHWRNAAGWFSYELQNKNKEAKKIRITCYGRERNRGFEIYVNEQLLAKVSMDGSGGDQFINRDYDIPGYMSNNEKFTIRFQAQPGASTARIFHVRLMK